MFSKGSFYVCYSMSIIDFIINPECSQGPQIMIIIGRVNQISWRKKVEKVLIDKNW